MFRFNVSLQIAPGGARMLAVRTIVSDSLVHCLLVHFQCKETRNLGLVATQVTNGGNVLLLSVRDVPLAVRRLNVPLKVKSAPTGPVTLLTRVEHPSVLCCIVFYQVRFSLRLVIACVTKQPIMVLPNVRLEKHKCCKSFETDQTIELLLHMAGQVVEVQVGTAPGDVAARFYFADVFGLQMHSLIVAFQLISRRCSKATFSAAQRSSRMCVGNVF